MRMFGGQTVVRCGEEGLDVSQCHICFRFESVAYTVYTVDCL